MGENPALLPHPQDMPPHVSYSPFHSGRELMVKYPDCFLESWQMFDNHLAQRHQKCCAILCLGQSY